MSTSFTRHRRAMAIWLLTVCAMTFGMVILGGLTRLTHSGLSMTTWSFTGGLPPLTEAGWQAEFARYQQFPEYQQLNQGMTLGGFKSIFWYEYSHRMLGRTIGSVYLFPFVFFAVRRAIPRWLLPRLVGLLCLLVMQGLVGWWMVRSGLVDRPDVSHLRLTTHLGLAFAFEASLWWVALSLIRDPSTTPVTGTRPLGWALFGATAMVYATALLGGLVAGLDAGFSYNTFPLMGGKIVPAGYLALTPWWSNGLENIAAVQFNHRWMAIATLATIAGLWLWSRRLPLAGDARRAMNGVLFVAGLQVSLGIVTLLSVVWLPVASAHQACALLLMGTCLWAAHVVRHPRKGGAEIGTSGLQTVTMRSRGK